MADTQTKRTGPIGDDNAYRWGIDTREGAEFQDLDEMVDACSIRLIPRSGFDPELRDEINEDLALKMDEADAQLRLWEAQLRRLSLKDDYLSRMEALSITMQHADLIGKFYGWEHDMMIGMLAALQEAAKHAKDESWMYEDTPDQAARRREQEAEEEAIVLAQQKTLDGEL
ncbi:MAG: hypothetical protein JKX85_06190 [Phycisphaeraceae bacterium]|nr:hypothetical protein [Phycisphaeraceae bacterium]